MIKAARTDPPLTITKFIKMGVRSSLINIFIEFVDQRRMTVNFNSEESSLFQLLGGGQQGSWSKQTCFITASDDNTEHVQQKNRYKFSDNLNILEIIILGQILKEYDLATHVPKDIGVEEGFIPAQELEVQANLNQEAIWTDLNKMKLKESKTD